MLTNSEPENFFDPTQPLQISDRNLPHWFQEGKTYYITYRLGDSIPSRKLKLLEDERAAWRRCHLSLDKLTEIEKAEYYRLFHARVERWLDQGHGSCILVKPPISQLVADAMLFFNGTRYHLGEWVIMPNHVHVVFVLQRGHDISKILHSWKSYTAHKINKLLNRDGCVWQEETYDHLVRNAGELSRINQYIRDNPAKAELAIHHASWL